MLWRLLQIWLYVFLEWTSNAQQGWAQNNFSGFGQNTLTLCAGNQKRLSAAGWSWCSVPVYKVSVASPGNCAMSKPSIMKQIQTKWESTFNTRLLKLHVLNDTNFHHFCSKISHLGNAVMKVLLHKLLDAHAALFYRFPVVAMGLLKWVDCTVCDPSFFKLLTDSTPVHLALLDEVSRTVDE